jgi:hypothetical protein
MKRDQRGSRAMRLLVALSMVTVLMLALVGPAAAQGPVSAVRGAPAKDGAIVNNMAGFPIVESSDRISALERMGPEGVIIRNSTIKDGKIIIPPGGIYYTIRTGGARFPLTNHPVLVLGKTYYVGGVDIKCGVKRDFEIKLKEAVPFGGDWGLDYAVELTSIGSSWGLTKTAAATFSILKPSGNYYGTTFPASGAADYARSAEDGLAGKPLAPGYNYQDDPISGGKSTWIIVKTVEKDKAFISEVGACLVATSEIGDKAYTYSLGTGQSGDLGKYKAKVTALDNAGMTVKVAIVSADMTEKILAEKTLGPITAQMLARIGSSSDDYTKLQLKYEDVMVGLDALNAPFATSGKVNLVGVSGLIAMTQGAPFPLDPKWVPYIDT